MEEEVPKVYKEMLEEIAKKEEKDCIHGALVPDENKEADCFACGKHFNKKEFKKWVDEST